jgi:hypothetical protein
VTLYLDIDQIDRPQVPDDVGPVPGIASHYSYFFLSRGVLAMRPYICFCPACSCVRGRGPELGTVSRGSFLDVPGCTSTKLTVWQERQITVTRAAGVANRQKRLAELWAKLEKEVGGRGGAPLPPGPPLGLRAWQGH